MVVLLASVCIGVGCSSGKGGGASDAAVEPGGDQYGPWAGGAAYKIR
jgi:hypothetical protein